MKVESDEATREKREINIYPPTVSNICDIGMTFSVETNPWEGLSPNMPQ
jgi:hypothetical protein